MIEIVTNGKDRRRIFRFVCKQCGCVYDATEDEGEYITRTSMTTFEPDFTEIDINEKKTLLYIGMKLECPMVFCHCKNTSFNIINNEELERRTDYKYINGKYQYLE